jgi:hypothetical protein
MLGTNERPGSGDPGHYLPRFTAASSETACCHYLVLDLTTVREMVVLFVLPSPVPVMVMVLVPVLARELTVSLSVDVPVPGAPMDVGLKLAVTLLGRPLADSAIAE